MPARTVTAILLLAFMPAIYAKPKNWEPSIKAFEEKDKTTPPPENLILFIGSSSIRGWNLKKSFPDLPTLNRGFGGSELSDSIKYFDRIVLPYKPRAILLYAGDNDINNGESSAQVVADYKTFAAKVRTDLPNTHFAFLPIKPSLKRWQLWPGMRSANEAIRKLSEKDPHLHYLDTATPMFGKDGKPMPNLFKEDGLHLTEIGYALWNKVIAPWLKAL
jgi:lysophospholipase L1-like esterase